MVILIYVYVCVYVNIDSNSSFHRIKLEQFMSSLVLPFNGVDTGRATRSKKDSRPRRSWNCQLVFIGPDFDRYVPNPWPPLALGHLGLEWVGQNGLTWSLTWTSPITSHVRWLVHCSGRCVSVGEKVLFVYHMILFILSYHILIWSL